MRAELFCDTSYFVARLDPHDTLHEKAKALGHEHAQAPLCTTHSVIVETLNYFSRYQQEIRNAAAELAAAIERHERFAIIHLTPQLLQSSIAFYKQRRDKSYSGTDCISMLVMQKRGIRTVMTSDMHFRQEGFDVLLAGDT